MTSRPDQKLEELRQTANHELDQMDRAFALAKNFSQMFDSYMKRLGSLVGDLIGGDAIDEGVYSGGYSVREVKNPFAKRESTERTRKRASGDYREYGSDFYRMQANSGRDKDYYGDNMSVYTANFNSEPLNAEFWKRGSFSGQRPAESNKEEGMMSALQMQSLTINKIIEAGEANSKNLREILETMFADKETTSSTEQLSERILRLKTKVQKLKVELNTKEAENQELKIELSVSQSLKKKIEGSYENSRKDRMSEAPPLKVKASSCRACDALKTENTGLVKQLEFLMKRLEVLNQNVESMQNEYIELYKTIQGRSQSLAYQSNTRDYVIELNESHGMFNINTPTSLDSNYNNIINKLETLEAGLLVQNQLIQKEGNQGRPLDFSYNSFDGNRRGNDTSLANTKLIDFHYSYLTTDGFLDERPRYEVDKRPVEGETGSTNLSMPLESVLTEDRKEKQRAQRMKVTSLEQIVPEKQGAIQINLPKNIKVIKKHGNRNDTDQIVETNLLMVSENIGSDQQYDSRHRESEERYSIVDMVNSTQNSLEARDSLFRSQGTHDRNNVFRISLAQRKDHDNVNWSDVRTSKDEPRVINESIPEPQSGDERDSGSEDIKVSKPDLHNHEFYTFSNRQSRRVSN